jgi:hypothetical protein
MYKEMEIDKNLHDISEDVEKESTHSTNSSTISSTRSDKVDTYVISLPRGKKLNKKMLKYASMKKIDVTDGLEQISLHLEEIEKATIDIVNNVKTISVSCTNCCVSMNCLSNNDVDANVSAV